MAGDREQLWKFLSARGTEEKTVLKLEGRKVDSSQLNILTGFGLNYDGARAVYVAPAWQSTSPRLVVSSGMHTPGLQVYADGKKVVITIEQNLDYIIFHHRKDVLRDRLAREAIAHGETFSYEDLRKASMSL